MTAAFERFFSCQSTLDHFPLEKFIVLVWAQGQKEYKIVKESNHNIVLEKLSKNVHISANWLV